LCPPGDERTMESCRGGSRMGRGWQPGQRRAVVKTQLKATDFGKLLTVKQAAERLGVSWWTVGRWCRQRRFRSVKLGARRLVPEAELARLLAANVCEATAADELKMV